MSYYRAIESQDTTFRFTVTGGPVTQGAGNAGQPVTAETGMTPIPPLNLNPPSSAAAGCEKTTPRNIVQAKAFFIMALSFTTAFSVLPELPNEAGSECAPRQPRGVAAGALSAWGRGDVGSSDRRGPMGEGEPGAGYGRMVVTNRAPFHTSACPFVSRLAFSIASRSFSQTMTWAGPASRPASNG
jgi:hypothetical protein